MKRSKRRQRTFKPRVLILCEGETEKNYFQAIKEDPDYKQALSAVTPQVVAAKNPTPEEVVKEAISRSEKEAADGNPYNKVWVVIDHDNHAHRREAYETAIGKEYGIAFSSICFEKWYLLHFVKSTKAYANANELLQELKKHYMGYEKAKQNDFANLKEKLDTAFENAGWLRKQVNDVAKHLTDHNPWTDVDVLVQELINTPNT